jgi:glycosyltransferase involved in cell wall biosynthesis
VPAILMIAYTNYETDPRVIRSAEAAVELGWDVDFLALRRCGQPSQEIQNGVRILRLKQERYRGRSRAGYVLAYLAFFSRCFWKSAILFARRRYSVVHVNNMPDALVFAALIPRILGAKVILDIHDPMPETFGAKYGQAGSKGLYGLLLALERLSVSFASKTITVNHCVRDGVLVRHGYAAEAIEVVANFADDRLFKPITPAPVDGYVRFVFHGTILERYGLRTLVEAVAKVRHKSLIRVRVIGEGDFGPTFRNLIDSRGVDHVIEFVNRVYPLREIPQVLADCQVGLVPLDVTPISDFALPLKLIEYTCLGIPSITVKTTAVCYYFKPEECILYPPGDSTALAEAMDRVVEDRSLLDELRSKLPAARERLSWSREKLRYMNILRELAGELVPSESVSACGR